MHLAYPAFLLQRSQRRVPDAALSDSQSRVGRVGASA
jgi:hypothetical protein